MKISYYETCNSQYHAGHSIPVVQVPVDGNTTFKEVRDMLLDPQATEHLDVLGEFNLWKEYDIAVNYLFDYYAEQNLPKRWDFSLDVPRDDQDEWDVYAYFVLFLDEESEDE